MTYAVEEYDDDRAMSRLAWLARDDQAALDQACDLSNQILELTTAIHAMNSPRSPAGSNGTEQATRSSIDNAMGG